MERMMPERQSKRLFVGGLTNLVDKNMLARYFGQFGSVLDSVVLSDRVTGVSRGFGFVTFSEVAEIELALQTGPHVIAERRVDVKRALPRSSSYTNVSLVGARDKVPTKIFIGGIPQHLAVEDIQEYFETFGPVKNATLLPGKDQDSPYGRTDPPLRHRGFGFIVFFDEEVAAKVIALRYHSVKGVQIEAKTALHPFGQTTSPSASSPGKTRLPPGVAIPDAKLKSAPYSFSSPGGNYSGSGANLFHHPSSASVPLSTYIPVGSVYPSHSTPDNSYAYDQHLRHFQYYSGGLDSRWTTDHYQQQYGTANVMGASCFPTTPTTPGMSTTPTMQPMPLTTGIQAPFITPPVTPPTDGANVPTNPPQTRALTDPGVAWPYCPNTPFAGSVSLGVNAQFYYTPPPPMVPSAYSASTIPGYAYPTYPVYSQIPLQHQQQQLQQSHDTPPPGDSSCGNPKCPPRDSCSAEERLASPAAAVHAAKKTRLDLEAEN